MAKDKALTTIQRSKNLVILGMHRSGTSMIAGGLSRCGLRAGSEDELMPASFDNPRGFWERRDVVTLNDELLASVGSSWFLPAIVDSPRVVEMQAILGRLDRQTPWLLKDPRLIFTWPVWESALKNTAKLFVYRSPLAVAASLKERHGFPLGYSLDLWEAYNCQALTIIQAEGGALIHYEAFSEAPQSAWEELCRRLVAIGVDVQVNDAGAHYEQQLDHSVSDSIHEDRLSAKQFQLHRFCLEACRSGELPTELPVPDADLMERVQEFGKAFSELAQVPELRSALAVVTSERDKARNDFNNVQTKAEKACSERDKARSDFNNIQAILESTVESERKLQGKADYLFEKLDLVYLKLLAFSATPIGRFDAFIVMLYKLITLRPRSSTALEDILDEAAEHVSEYKSTLLPASKSRVKLAFSVLSYVSRHPVSSLRSMSWPRFKRALSVFFGNNRQDLEVWIQQRFPEIDDFAMPEVKPELDSVLDSLQLDFPAAVNPRVSIIIPVYNEYRMTVYCLQSLLDNTSDVTYEVIIADDASTDLTGSIAERIGGVQVIRAEENQGFVNNCRNGASYARGDFILFLNNDTAFTTGWLSQLVAALDADPQAGIVGPMLLFGNGRLQEAGGIIWDDASGWNFGRMDDPAMPEYNYLKETDYVSGACLLIRRGLWEELGGFDQRFVPAYYEDTDLCFSTRAAGYKVLYQPTARVYHFEGMSHGTDLSSGVKKHQVVNQGKFLDKWASTLRADHFPNAERVFLAKDRSRDRRTVLVIDHYVPSYDKDAGSRSTWLYLQLMVEMGYNVKFIGANFFPHQPYTKALQAIGIEVLVGEKMARSFPSWLRENAASIETVYVHRPHIAEQFLLPLSQMNPRPKLIYFGHDLHFLRVQRESAITGDRKLSALSDDWKRRELAVFEGFDKVYYPSQVEVDVIAEVAPKTDVSAIPLYVLDDCEQCSYIWKDRRDILFVAGFNHTPNVDGLCWFVDEVLPLVTQVFPDIKLHVVGANAPTAVTDVASDQVIIHGYLSDEELAQQYRQARMVAVPLRYGAGVKGKVLEALQHGLPLVTTPIGAEGLPDADVVFNVKEMAADFANELIELERGCEERLRKLDLYPDYLNQNFSKTRASEILRRDFGDPHIHRVFDR